MLKKTQEAPSEKLLGAFVNVLPIEESKKFYDNLLESQITVGGLKSVNAPCKGTAGIPLVKVDVSNIRLNFYQLPRELDFIFFNFYRNAQSLSVLHKYGQKVVKDLHCLQTLLNISNSFKNTRNKYNKGFTIKKFRALFRTLFSYLNQVLLLISPCQQDITD